MFFQSFQLKIILGAWCAICLFACQKEAGEPENPTYENGILVVNQGSFSSPSTISFIQKETREVSNQIYSTQNAGFPLGSFAQSAFSNLPRTYLLVSNSDKIEIVSRGYFKKLKTIESLKQPRYMIAIDDTRAVISYWGEGGIQSGVALYDLSTDEIIQTLQTGSGAEGMLVSGSKLYVANAGGFGKDSTVVKIDIPSFSIEKTLVIGDGPSFLQEVGGEILILCQGVYDFNSGTFTSGALARVKNDEVVSKQNLTGQPIHLVKGQTNASTNDLYFLRNDGLYLSRFNPSINGLPIPEKIYNGYFYSLAFDPDGNTLYLGDPKDFASPGQVIQVSMDGMALDSFSVGIAPGHISLY